MAMKFKYDRKDDIPKGQESFYVERDGAFYLDVDGVVPSSELKAANDRLSEFRTNNISLSQQLKEFEGKRFLSQEEQEEFDNLKKQAQDLHDKKLIDSGKIEELLASRTERMRTDYSNQIEGFKKKVGKAEERSNTLEQRLAAVLVEAEVGKVLSDAGFQPVKGALADIVSRARNTWKVNDKGFLVALDGNGNPAYGSDPSTPLTMAEWAANTAKDAPYLFMESQGTGGTGSGSGDGNRGGDGTIRIPRSDEAMKSKHIADIASGKAILVD